ncbi:SETMAR [Cordylochernes scorpioides]|uniref:SETMAR n=1 Tax=Cordylochernes scorpioides TaxID=51811 RepID=A0ABY6L8D4_9ARAC|nr:SETMAR [Cordylochernes scorpioides]
MGCMKPRVAIRRPPRSICQEGDDVGMMDPFENGISRRHKSTFSTYAFLRFSSRLKSSRSSSVHMQRGSEQVKNGFQKFKNGDLDLEDTPRSGRSSEFNKKHLKTLLKEDGRQKTVSWPKKMKCSAVTIFNQ